VVYKVKFPEIRFIYKQRSWEIKERRIIFDSQKCANSYEFKFIVRNAGS